MRASRSTASPRSASSLDGPAEHFAFLAAYERVDIALDTFPYSGGTTTMEALWQGVPVLTFNGDRWASRTSRSLLLAAGLDAWCLADRDAFVARAIALARSPATPADARGAARRHARPAGPHAGLRRRRPLPRPRRSVRADRAPPTRVLKRGLLEGATFELSPPRKRGSRASDEVSPWMPAFAGMTK